ncbi:MAG TPA: tetratricopeptide repeat protein [Terriglobales bacterium]|nr:tetratricopeptide repeat protein [Terriglobales bacterium]
MKSRFLAKSRDLEQLATKRVLLGTNLGHSALIHTLPSRSSNVILWSRSARGLFLLAVLGCLQASAQQKPASPLDEFERRFAAANSAKEAGDLPAAAAASEKIVALGLREMGKLRLLEAAYPEAARFSRRSLEFEDVADAHVDLAAANLSTSRVDEALKEISQALAADPRNATAWIIQGQAQIKKKDYRAAVESFQKSLEIRPERETSYGLASCWLQLKEKEKAEAIFQQMTVASGDRSSLHLLFGDAYRKATLYGDAIREFQRALSLDPKVPNGHYFLGLTYLMQHEWVLTPEARRQFLEQLRVDPGNFYANYLLGYLSFSSHQPEADHYLGEAARLNPSSSEAWLYLGLNAYRRKENQRAERLFRKAIALAERSGVDAHSDIRKGYTSLGRILIASGRAAEGEQYFEKARAIQRNILAENQERSGTGDSGGSGVSPADVSSLSQNEPPVPLGGTGKDAATPSGSSAPSHAKLTQGQQKQAAAQEEFLRSVLGGAFSDLATVEAMQEQYAVALGHYQEAEGWDPKVPNLMRNLGFTAYRAGNQPEAIRALRKALALAPGDDEARALLRELGTTVTGQVPQKKEDKKP